jgi:hypothetical protein
MFQIMVNKQQQKYYQFIEELTIFFQISFQHSQVSQRNNWEARRFFGDGDRLDRRNHGTSWAGPNGFDGLQDLGILSNKFADLS